MYNAMSLTPQTIVSRGEGVLEAEVDGEVILLKLESGMCCGFNRIGSEVWKIIADPIRVVEMCDRLVARFDVEREICEQQILDFLKEMYSEGLVNCVA